VSSEDVHVTKGKRLSPRQLVASVARVAAWLYFLKLTEPFLNFLATNVFWDPMKALSKGCILWLL
jgi:hypothetical protein